MDEIINHEATQSALYHIEQAERRLRMLKVYINPNRGSVSDMQVVSGLVLGLDDNTACIRDALVKFL